MRTNDICVYLIVNLNIITSCVDPISFETSSEIGEVVFYGEFNQFSENHVINISRTSNFGSMTVPESEADVQIFDNLGNNAAYVEQDSGTYELEAESFPGVVGRFYHVEITLINGIVFISSPQQLLQPVEIDDIYFKVEPEQVLSSSGNQVDQAFINIYIDTPLPQEAHHVGGIQWKVEEAYSFTDLQCHPFFDFATTCYFRIPVENTEIKMFEIDGNSQGSLNKYLVHSRILAPDDEFLERHYFSVYQKTLPIDAYKYWEKVKIVANQSGDLFDQPPARVFGNIRQKENPNKRALGYFEVSGTSLRRISTLPYLIGDNYIVETCPESRSVIIQDKCCFCYLLDEADNRIERPEYWGD